MKTNLTEYLEEQVAICAEKTAVSDENTSVTVISCETNFSVALIETLFSKK